MDTRGMVEGYGRGTAWGVALACVACVGPPASSAASANVEPESAAPAAVSMAQGQVVADNPLSCVDPPALPTPREVWGEEVDRRVERELGRLQSCGDEVKGVGEWTVSIQLEFAEDGAPKAQRVHSSTSGDCRVANCVKKALAAVRAPESPEPLFRDSAASPGVATRTVAFGFKPGATLQRLSLADVPPTPESPGDTKNCVEEPADGNVARGGRLPPELIQRLVRKHFGSFRSCYEAGLGRNRNLEGRVDVRFVIGIDGKVSRVRLHGNTLPDCVVARCIRDRFASIVFPKPEGGIVTVVYPIMLAPG